MSTAANPYTVPINVTGSFGRNFNTGRNNPTPKKQPLWKSATMATVAVAEVAAAAAAAAAVAVAVALYKRTSHGY
ncbi:hypothetical protein MAR_013104 [Mya arenaria]|uniref:Uncharacterized protein n=1 Tax=Mya arenaria TaxID=6604 RepID=A0ABY7FYW7_MYAAR|nr:hypothetical protein MAR_013104 [Mya arenaria]